jgi:hypothetical protein
MFFASFIVIVNALDEEQASTVSSKWIRSMICHILSLPHCLCVVTNNLLFRQSPEREKKREGERERQRNNSFIVRDAVFVCNCLIHKRKCIFHNNRLSSKDYLRVLACIWRLSSYWSNRISDQPFINGSGSLWIYRWKSEIGVMGRAFWNFC